MFCILGIHKLSNGETKSGVEYLKESLAHLMDTTDPTMRILKIIAFQIVATYYESTINTIEATKFFENAVDECRALKNCFLILSPNEKRIVDQQDVSGVGGTFPFTKATKLFSSAERTKSFEENVRQMKENSDTNLLSNPKEGSFYLHRFIAGVLAEMTRYEEALILIQNLMLSEGHKYLAYSYFSVGIAQYQMIDYTSALQSHQRALEIRRKTLGENHPNTAVSYNNIGVTKQAL